MSSLGSVKIIKKPPPAKVMAQAINQEIIKQLQPVGRQHVSERKRVVADFDHKPEFGYRVSATEKQITLTVLLENASEPVSEEWTIGDLWKALDSEGTPPHDIGPKDPNGQLTFEYNGPGSYSPHTRPVARFGGPGKVENGQVFRTKRGTVLKHPGFPPRKFSDSINKRLRRQYDAAIDRGVRLGSKKY